MVSIKSLIVATFAVGLVSSAPTGTLDKRWGPIYCETSGGSPWSGDVSVCTSICRIDDFLEGTDHGLSVQNAARQFQGTVAASSGAPGCMAIGRSAGSAQIGLCCKFIPESVSLFISLTSHRIHSFWILPPAECYRFADHDSQLEQRLPEQR